MTERGIFATAERLRREAKLLHSGVLTLLPEIEAALHKPDEGQGDGPTPPAPALSRLEGIAKPSRQVLLSLDELIGALGGSPVIQRSQEVVSSGVSKQTSGINFERFKKLAEA